MKVWPHIIGLIFSVISGALVALWSPGWNARRTAWYNHHLSIRLYLIRIQDPTAQYLTKSKILEVRENNWKFLLELRIWVNKLNLVGHHKAANILAKIHDTLHPIIPYNPYKDSIEISENAMNQLINNWDNASPNWFYLLTGVKPVRYSGEITSTTF